MIKHRESSWWYLLNGVARRGIVKGYVPNSRHVIVNEFPKSGGSWLSQMIAESLDIPFPQSQLPSFKPCLMHGHYGGGWDAKNMVVMWRDGRDVIVSMYYHYFFQQEKGSPRIQSIIKDHLDFKDIDDINNNLPRFIDFVFKDKVTPKFSWSDHVECWIDRDVCFTRYEDLRSESSTELKRVLNCLGYRDVSDKECSRVAEKYSFENQSGRKPGTENKNSFIRKGVVGDWRNHFSRESRELFDKYAGNALINIGYEQDRSWID